MPFPTTYRWPISGLGQTTGDTTGSIGNTTGTTTGNTTGTIGDTIGTTTGNTAGVNPTYMQYYNKDQNDFWRHYLMDNDYQYQVYNKDTKSWSDPLSIIDLLKTPDLQNLQYGTNVMYGGQAYARDRDIGPTYIIDEYTGLPYPDEDYPDAIEHLYGILPGYGSKMQRGMDLYSGSYYDYLTNVLGVDLTTPYDTELDYVNPNYRPAKGLGDLNNKRTATMTPNQWMWEPGNYVNKKIMNAAATIGGNGWNPYKYEQKFYDVPMSEEGKQWTKYVKAMNADNGLNPLSVILGLASFAIPGLGPAIGGALGLTGTTASVVGGGLLGGLSSAISGGNPLIGAVTGGLGGFAPAAGGAISGALGVSPQIGNAIYQGGLGALSAGLNGGNPLTGGLAGGLGSYVGSSITGSNWGQTNPTMSNALAGLSSNLIRQLILSGRINPMSLGMSTLTGGLNGYNRSARQAAQTGVQ